MNRLILIGASGHSKVVAGVAKLSGYTGIVFLDNDISISSCYGYPILELDTMVKDLNGDVFIVVGKAKIRKRLMERNSNQCFPVLIYHNSVIAEDVERGGSNVVMAGVVINPGVRIGRGCIINTSSSIDHDCIIGDYCHISVCAHLSGTVKVGVNVWIGAGSTVSNNINICSDTTIGAGVVVIKDLDMSGTYIGVPAKKPSKSMLTVGGDYSANLKVLEYPSVNAHSWQRGRVA